MLGVFEDIRRRSAAVRHLKSAVRGLLVVLLVQSGSGGLAAAEKAGQEILYPGEAFSKLDTFEGVNLEDADKQFAAGDVNGAYAAYKAYSFEFPKSKALPYVLLRMGRCLHKLDKRNAAIKAYQDVVDYFPDDVRYAGAALYYIGECHGQNGDEVKKTATWARMVKDDGYVTQPNSGTALTYLGGAMEKLGKFNEATEYQWRTAVAFLKTNPDAAAAARKAVIAHYVGRNPDHDKLKEFYVAASGFDGRGRNTDKPEEDVNYWTTVLESALGMKDDPKAREQACTYWSAKMGDRFTENDDLRRLWSDVRLVHEKDAAAWVARMEKQYTVKPASLDRILQWCGYYKSDGKLRSGFFAKHTKDLLAGMKAGELMDLMKRLHKPLEMDEEAQTVMRSVKLADLSDEEIVRFATLAADYQPEEQILAHFARMKDKLAATKARFDYYNGRSYRNPPFMEKALAEIPELLKSPKYADGLIWTKAVLLQGLGRHEEAILAFRAANKQPESTWEIVKCMVALKQYDQAVKTVSELESVGGATASAASFKVADIYRTSGDKGREVTQLRSVLRRYPKSTESSEAHNRLESYGVALSGGEAEAEK